jgi:hypothetical protein
MQREVVLVKADDINPVARLLQDIGHPCVARAAPGDLRSQDEPIRVGGVDGIRAELHDVVDELRPGAPPEAGNVGLVP